MRTAADAARRNGRRGIWRWNGSMCVSRPESRTGEWKRPSCRRCADRRLRHAVAFAAAPGGSSRSSVATRPVFSSVKNRIRKGTARFRGSRSSAYPVYESWLEETLESGRGSEASRRDSRRPGREMGWLAPRLRDGRRWDEETAREGEIARIARRRGSHGSDH
jgi:hypothetical protein